MAIAMTTAIDTCMSMAMTMPIATTMAMAVAMAEIIAVAKAGVLHLTKCAATDLARHGIRVNAVQPGFINTNIFTASLELTGEMKAMAKAAIAQMSANAQPVARGGQSMDIANAVAFLASEEAGFVTGTSLLVDGGLTVGPRHSWDPEEPGLLASLEAMEAQAREAQKAP